MSDTIRALVVEPCKEPYIKDIESGLESLQKEVGGLIEAFYPYEDAVCIICNEEGKINGLPLNRAIYDDDKNMIEIMAGTFLVTGLTEENFGSLSDEQVLKYGDMFKNPETFLSISGEIIALPYKAEDKKPSIRQQLAAIKENTAEKKDIPKTKNKEIGGESL